MTQDIAIVGMSCRLPAAPNLDAFWHLLSEGRSAITEVPSERWDLDRFYDIDSQAAGKANTRWGGFIEDADRFDPDFFAMSHEEAAIVDPQQRMMLELGWEALEHAAIDPHTLKRSQAGVYVGISHNDYERITCRDPSRITKFHGTGAYQSMAANRLSYFLDTVGPSMTIDTACSSGLAALHVACQHLRSGETPLAIIGAVTLHLTAEETIGLAKGRLLSPDGQCKSFDENANGYVRAEGGVSMVLRRLGDALADGSRVLAVIKGSAVNHNGRSNGLSAPNGPALRAVMQQALDASGIQASQIDFVETHGTGTPLGDQLELKALRDVYGEASGDTPCWLGCLKTNMGHLETTSGLAALLKAVLAIQHGSIPPNLNFKKLPSRVDLSTSRLAFPTRQEPWPERSALRRAAVTAYGFGGANAHVILESAPGQLDQPTGRDATSAAQLLCISTANAAAHRDLLSRYADHLEQSDAFADICFSAATGRAQFDYRSAFVASSSREAARQIRAELAAESVRDSVPLRVKVAMFFPDAQSAPVPQRSGWHWHPAYRAAWSQCTDAVCSAGRSPAESDARIGAFSHAYAMAQLWSAWGVKPGAVSGQGVGQWVAAAVAGVVTPSHAISALLGLQPATEAVAPRIPLLDPHTGSAVAIESLEYEVRAETAPLSGDIPGLAQSGLVLAVRGSSGVEDDVLADLHRLYLAGAKILWASVFAGTNHRRVDLPQYPFQRVRCWFDPLHGGTTRLPDAARSEGTIVAASAHPSTRRLAVATSAQAEDRVAWLQAYARQRINSRLIDERRCIPPHVVLDFGNEGLMGLLVPTAWGGQGFGISDTLRVFEQAGAIDLTLASFLGVHNVLGTVPILNHGSPHLCEACLPQLASGRQLGAFAVTETGAGSNPRAMASSAVSDGRGAWALNGSKTWIGSAGWSKVISVFAYAYGEGGKPLGLTGFAVGADDEGVVLGPEALTMGVRGMVQNALTFSNVKVRDDHCLGTVGDGMTVAQETMQMGRLGIGAASLGAMKRCMHLVERFATRRSIAGGSLGNNTSYLAFLDTVLSMAESVAALIEATAQRVDRHETVPAEVFAAVKVVATESLGHVVDMSMQFTGGRGYIDVNPLSQLFRDARLMRIFEGPTETLLSHIGSSFVGSGRAVNEFIDALGAPVIATTLSHHIARLAQPVAGRPLHGLQWCEIGRVVCAALTWASVETRASGTGAKDTLALWCAAAFSEAVDTAARRIARSSHQDASELRQRAARMTDTIGDIDQRAAGADGQADAVWSPADSDTPPAVVPLQRAKPLPGDGEENEWLCELVADQLRRPVEEIDVDAPFNDFGVDSVAAVEIAFEIERRLGISIDATVLWSYPNIGALTRYLDTLKPKAVDVPVPTDTNSIADQLRRELEAL
jgi:alkylation response protein AidB-like acyl-CoA dehydrogenase/3-oxoacyl-(acyl-carrier-protein) synthase/acyl carrier protein